MRPNKMQRSKKQLFKYDVIQIVYKFSHEHLLHDLRIWIA